VIMDYDREEALWEKKGSCYVRADSIRSMRTSIAWKWRRKVPRRGTMWDAAFAACHDSCACVAD
jgi:hypothetical protein